MTVVNLVIDDLLEAAAKAEKQLRDNLSILKNRDDLNDKGVATTRKMFMDNYHNEANGLQRQAEARIKSFETIVAKKRVEVRQNESEKTRQVLGDLVYAQLLDQELEDMESDEIVRAYQEAAEGFEKTYIAEKGYILLRRRAATDSHPKHLLAMRAFESKSEELKILQLMESDLRQAKEILPQLNLVEWREQLAPRLGVSPKFFRAGWEEAYEKGEPSPVDEAKPASDAKVKA